MVSRRASRTVRDSFKVALATGVTRMRLRPDSRRAYLGTKRPTPDHCWRRRLTPTAGFVAGQATRVTAVAVRTVGWTRPGCQLQPWTVPWRALARDARRREALLSWRVARVHMPGRRNDRRRPARSAAWWGLLLQSTSPTSRHASGLYIRLARLPLLLLSTTHTPASAFPTPRAVRHKRKPLLNADRSLLSLTSLKSCLPRLPAGDALP